jgi:hypothetical protein
MPLRALALALLTLGLAVPATASAATPSDLEWTGEITSSSGNQHSVRLTVTNLGPGPALTDGIWGSIYLEGLEVASQPTGCERQDANGANQYPHLFCPVGKALAVGQTRTLDFVVRALSGTTKIDLGSRVEWSNDDFADPNYENNSDTLFIGAGCKVTAKSPQKATKRGLRLTIKAPAAKGCVAAMKSAVLKIGSKKYVFIAKRPQRTLDPGERWTLNLPFGAAVLSAIRKAHNANRRVSAWADFDIDGVARRGKAIFK